MILATLALSGLPHVDPHLMDIYTVFDRLGFGGSYYLSAYDAVERARGAGAVVHWMAGGGENVPLAAALATRTAAVIAGADAFVALHPGPGTLKACAKAAARGIPVYALAKTRPKPVPGQAGDWEPATLETVQVWRWHPAQKMLF